jgi:hypothetical protein
MDCDSLVGFNVWVPMLETDSRDSSERQAKRCTESRIAQFWDGDRQVSRLFSDVLGLSGYAWDSYLVYEAGVRWTETVPPGPDFWMHQLSSDPQAPRQLRLDDSRLYDLIKSSV